MNAKEKSRAYFNAHRKSRLARGGYWRADYRHVMKEIERFRPASLIDIGCGSGGFLCAVQKCFPDIQLNALDHVRILAYYGELGCRERGNSRTGTMGAPLLFCWISTLSLMSAQIIC